MDCLTRTRTAFLGIIAASFLVSLPRCVVSQHCFVDDDCLRGERCNAIGRCEIKDSLPLDIGTDADGHTTIHCPLPGMTRVAELFCIDVYEASRPDASATSAGTDNSRAQSREGAIPWQVTSNQEAQLACEAASKRLCTPTEWQRACQGPQNRAYAYGDAYNPTSCNGIDTFNDRQFKLMPAGSFPECTNQWGVYDMNGNVWEHTANGDNTTIRGGAFNCSDSRTLHRCDYVPANWEPSARGFRCCADGVTGPVDGGGEIE